MSRHPQLQYSGLSLPQPGTLLWVYPMLPYGGKPRVGFKGKLNTRTRRWSNSESRIPSSAKYPTTHPTSSPYQHSLPEQKQHFLHGEVWSMATAEFGHHPKEHDREGFIVVQGGSWKHTAP